MQKSMVLSGTMVFVCACGLDLGEAKDLFNMEEPSSEPAEEPSESTDEDSGSPDETDGSVSDGGSEDGSDSEPSNEPSDENVDSEVGTLNPDIVLFSFQNGSQKCVPLPH